MIDHPPDLQAVQSFADIALAGCMEVRIFGVDRTGHAIQRTDKYSKVFAGWFDDPEKLTQAVGLVRNASVYVVANPAHPGHLARSHNRLSHCTEVTKDSGITCLSWALIDIDSPRPPGLTDVSATQGERDIALAVRDRVLAEHSDIRDASIWGTSGNGGFILARLPDYPPDDAHVDLIGQMLRSLAERFNADGATIDPKCRNPARLIPLPGTWKCKGDSTDDRPWRLVEVHGRGTGGPLDVAGWVGRFPAVPAPQANGTAPRLPRRGGRPSVEDRAARYLDAMAPAVSGQGGHPQTFDAACTLIHDFGLSPDAARPILTEWAGRCIPPWSPGEIDHKLDNAAARSASGKCRGERGHLRDEMEAPRNGHSGARGAGIGNPEGGDAPAVPVNRTDLGNAMRFAAQHGAGVRYCYPWSSWLVWDGKRWAQDTTGEAERLAKRTVRAIRDEAGHAGDDDEAKALWKWSLDSEGRRRIESMLALARSEPGIPVLTDQLDRDPWLLNCPNGTLDLRTGTLRPHDPADLITKLCPVPFDPAAACPLWEETLDRIFAGDAELIDYWQRLCGCALSADVSEQILPILHGKGANGKSTVLGVLSAMLGPDYSMKATPDLLMTRRNESHPTERADLFGMRLVLAIETEEGRSINESLIKELTGGDKIRARRLYEDAFEFSPTHKIMLCSNHRPAVRGTDHAIWRRLRLIPFTVTIPEAEQDKDLPRHLAGELPGILAWCARGCTAWREHGLDTPPAVTDATAAYKSDEDTLGSFLDDNCLISPMCRCRASLLYARYRQWTEGSGEKTLSQKKFGHSLADRGFERLLNNGTWYLGLGLREEEREEDRFE